MGRPDLEDAVGYEPSNQGTMNPHGSSRTVRARLKRTCITVHKPIAQNHTVQPFWVNSKSVLSVILRSPRADQCAWTTQRRSLHRELASACSSCRCRCSQSISGALPNEKKPAHMDEK